MVPGSHTADPREHRQQGACGDALSCLARGRNLGLGRRFLSGSRSSFKNMRHVPCAKSGPKGCAWRFSIGGGHPRRGPFPWEVRTQGVLGLATHEGSSCLPPAPGSTTAWSPVLQGPPQECTPRSPREGALWACSEHRPCLRSPGCAAGALGCGLGWSGLACRPRWLVGGTPGVGVEAQKQAVGCSVRNKTGGCVSAAETGDWKEEQECS